MASFSELYGVAPAPVDPAATPPPVYEEPAPPPPEAQAPPPASNSFASLYGVEGAPPVQQAPAPPQNFIPGSSYRPPDAEPLPAPAAPNEPPPDLEPWRVKDPTDAELEGMNPVERGLRENIPAWAQGFVPDVTGFQNAEGAMGKAGHLIGGLNVFSDYGTDRTVKRAVDSATVGDPNATMGGISPGDIIQNPSNILDIVPTFGANVPGGGEDELNDWLAVHPEVVAEYERTGDSQAVMDAWLADTGRTLETGGVPGMVAGVVRTGSQDVSIVPSAIISRGASVGANAARLAGREGLARGILVTDDIIQAGIDPAGVALGKTLGGIFGLSKEAENVARSDVTREVVGANLIERRAADTGAMTPNANLAPAPPPPTPTAPVPTPGPVTQGLPTGPIAMPGTGAPGMTPNPNLAPIATPQPVTQALPTGNAIALPQGTLLPPAQGAPNMTPNAANVPGQRVISPQGPNGRVRTPNAPTPPKTRPQTPSPNGTGSPFTNGRSIDPSHGTPNGKARGVAPIMRDPARGWVKATGDALTEQDLQIAYRHLETVDPDDMVEFPMGSAVVPNTQHRNAQYLAAMTERKWALDDWHAGRTGDKVRQAAGKRWTDLFAKRIGQFKEREVGRLVRDFQIELGRDTSPGAVVPRHRQVSSYWDNRARSIIEAANKAGYEESFEIRTPKGTHTYVGKNPSAPKQMTDMVPPVWTGNVVEDGSEAVMQTSLHFAGSERRDVVNRLMDMLDNPAAFGEDTASKQFRQRMYRSGAWSQTKASPVVATDSAAEVAKKAARNAAYERYQAFRAWHEAQHGASVSPEPALQAGKATPLISGPGRRVDTGFGLETMAGDVDVGLAKSLQDGFRAHLDQMGLGHVRLTFDDYLTYTDETGQLQQAPAFGQFKGGGDDLELAISYTMDEVVREARQSFGEDGLRILAETGELDNSVKRSLYQTLNHEALHGFRASGVIKDSEWKALVTEARKRGYHDWALDTYGPDPVTGRSVYQYDNTFDALTRGNDQFDEEAVAEMFGDFALGKAALSPATRNVFQRMVDLVKGLLEVVVRNDGQRVMEDLLSGKIGSRAPSVSRVNPWTGNTRYLQKGKRFSRTALGAMDTTPDEIDASWLGRLLTEPQKAVLRGKMPWKGADKSLFEISNEIADDADYLRFLAQQNQKTGLSGQMQKDFERLQKEFDLSKRIDGYEQRFDWSDAKMTDDEVDRIATALFMDEWQKAKLPNMNAKQKTAMFGAIMQLNADINGLRRSVGMSNPIGAVRQIFVQTFGNVATFSIAKPTAITGMFKPGEYVKAFRSQQSDAVLSPSRQFLKDFGFPDNAQIDMGTKSLAKNATGIQNRAIKGVSNVLAPKWSRNLVATPDDVARHAIFRASMIPGMKREQAALSKRGVEVWKAYDAKWKGQMPAIAPQEIEQTIQNTLKAKTQRFDPFSRATGRDIEEAILRDFGSRAGAGTPQAKKLADFANRIGRDWNSARNTNLQLATKEVQRVAFSWDNTKLDEFVGNFALYHYWASRAAGLYAKEFAKQPWKLAALAGMAEELQQDAERNNYPEWLKGMTRLTNSPAGMVLLASPLDLFGAMGIMEDWQFQNRDPLADDGRDNGWFGTLEGVVPLFFGPAVQYGAYVTGGMGGEARPPGSLVGIEASWKKAADIINAANLNGHLPAGMLRDENDMPVLIDHNAIANAVQGFSGRLFGTPQVDLDAGFKANHIFTLQGILREDHPEWQTDPDGENKLTRMVNDMKVKADMGEYSPEWLEAEQQVFDMQMTGPDYPGVPEPLKYLLRLASPIRMTALPEERTTTMYGFGNKERETIKVEGRDAQTAVTDPLGTRDSYDIGEKKSSPYDTTDMSLLAADLEDFYEFGVASGLADAARMSNAIGKGTVTSNFKIGDFTYTPEQISLMSNGEKWDLAEKYLNSKGFTQEDKDKFYEDKEALKDANPDVQGYLAFKNYAEKGFGQGPQAFVDQAVQTSPSYARYMAQLPYAPGTEKYYSAGLSKDAYYAIEGRRSSIYDPTTLPDRGTIPGMAYGTTFAQNAALQDAADAAAASSSGGGDGSSFDDFVADVDKKVTNLYHAQRLLDETYPGTGWRVGVTQIPYAEYKYLRDVVWKNAGVDAPEKNDIAIEYYEWLGANATAPDHDVRAFLNDRERTGGSSAELETPTVEQIAAQQKITLVESNQPQLTPNGQIDTSKMQRVTPLQVMEMRTGPSLSNPVNVQRVVPGLSMWIADIEGDWAEVVGPGGSVGWVPMSKLKAA